MGIESSPVPPPPAVPAPPLPPTFPPPQNSSGWLPDGTPCRRCGKAVYDHGGVFCGRLGDPAAGCGAAICWRCMRRAPREQFGDIRITKTKLIAYGDGGWWMHEHCMRLQDKCAYCTLEGNPEAASMKG